MHKGGDYECGSSFLDGACGCGHLFSYGIRRCSIFGEIMTITAVTGCKNEQDIIEPFVRHTLRFCDQLIILDNSLDDSKRILDQLAVEFPQLTLATMRDCSAFAYDQKLDRKSVV